MSELVIDENTRIQILDNVEGLARARKHQYAAFIRSESVLVVWADHVENVIPAAEALEEALIQFIWRGEEENMKMNQALVADLREAAEEHEDTKVEEENMDPEDVEMRQVKRQWKERPVMLIAPMMDGLSMIFCMALIALGLRILIKEATLDGKYMRFALFVFAPALCCIAAFACMCVAGSFFQIFGPVRQVTQKSRYYSGIAPKRTMGELSHVTVQLPVYKVCLSAKREFLVDTTQESLEDVIEPTIESLKKAITTYERQGGSVGILVCDDGLQLLDQREADRRRKFYFDNNIAYVARPGHGVDGFIRKGRFKKAGNMNYANNVSLRVEEVMDELRPAEKEKMGSEHFWSDLNENALYDIALKRVLDEREGKTWAAGNIRFGPIILIIDSDTRVPEDCFADAVSEMAESPELAILLPITSLRTVLLISLGVFKLLSLIVVRVEKVSLDRSCRHLAKRLPVAPFVGHNAFIRWSALQECTYIDPDDDVVKIWSEDHVSEDFAIAVTLQIKKYAFGCSELLFRPFKQWFRGPITPLFANFVWSSIPLHSKFTICGYIFSYYAIAVSWFLTVANYFLIGWNNLESWYVTLVCIILFVGLSNVSFITLRYRLKVPDCGKLAFDQIKWIPFFSVFFPGMSMPMSAALVSHLVGYNMTWSATVKSVEKSNFFLQLPIIWKRFWPQIVFFTACVGAMIVTTIGVLPLGYQVSPKNIEVLVPLGMVTAAHLLWPLVLNPWFLSFSF
ncbi:hypothetical protein P7C73_g331, partial [Tremellales sp. Uapishka_1]